MATTPLYPWQDLANHWHKWGPPLRPCADDIRVLESAVHAWKAANPRSVLQALLCGVTQEIARMNWPEPTELLAVDRSESMVRLIWPGDIPGRRRAVVGDWMNLSLAAQSQGVIIGDGCFALFDHPRGQRAFAGALQRILQPHGLFIMRFFVQAKRREKPAEVFQALDAGAIGNFHIFKWRLAMSLQEDSSRGVKLDDVWGVWNAAGIDPVHLAARTGWPEETIRTIDLYCGQQAHLYFSTLAEAQAVLAECFRDLSIHIPYYELGERCPIIYCCKGKSHETFTP